MLTELTKREVGNKRFHLQRRSTLARELSTKVITFRMMKSIQRQRIRTETTSKWRFKLRDGQRKMSYKPVSSASARSAKSKHLPTLTHHLSTLKMRRGPGTARYWSLIGKGRVLSPMNPWIQPQTTAGILCTLRARAVFHCITLRSTTGHQKRNRRSTSQWVICPYS